jgi:Gpi18-like mannosyltransferase
VATLPLPGHSDIILWKIWSYAAAHDVLSMYGVGGTPPTRGLVAWGDQTAAVDYPPFFLYEYAIVGRVFGALFPTFPDGTALLVAVKLPALLANIALTAVFYEVARRASGRAEIGQWAALAYWLNPATMFGGELLGYVDALYFLPAIAGLALAYFDRPWSAGVLVGIAVGTKPQGILIGPAFALALWQGGRVRAIASAAATFAATLTLIALPYYLKGALPNMWLAFGSFDERRDTMSAYAANIGRCPRR